MSRGTLDPRARGAARQDAVTLGRDLQDYYLSHDGPPPTIKGDWCLWVSAPAGKVKTWQYSSQGNLAPGSC